ncbi:MAG: hypothetical protein IPJ92_08175 [Veillonella sp.]|nr:hypothetical protein [Veillonella sp.]
MVILLIILIMMTHKQIWQVILVPYFFRIISSGKPTDTLQDFLTAYVAGQN